MRLEFSDNNNENSLFISIEDDVVCFTVEDQHNSDYPSFVKFETINIKSLLKSLRTLKGVYDDED